MDISKMDKAEVLRRLYNNAKPQGLGFLHYTPKEMTIEEARELIKNGIDESGSRGLYFDYVHGRVMKIDLSTDELRTGLYNRDNGTNAAEEALKDLRNYVVEKATTHL